MRTTNLFMLVLIISFTSNVYAKNGTGQPSAWMRLKRGWEAMLDRGNNSEDARAAGKAESSDPNTRLAKQADQATEGDPDVTGSNGQKNPYAFKGPVIGKYTEPLKPRDDLIGEEAFMWELAAATRNTKAAMPVVTAPNGAGKTSSWEYLQHLIDQKDERVRHLWGKTIHKVKLNDLLGGGQLNGTDDQKIGILLDELKSQDHADKIIVFDEFADMFRKEGEIGDHTGEKFFNAMKNMIAGGENKALLGASMTDDEYFKVIKDPAIQSRLKNIRKSAPSGTVVQRIIRNMADAAAEENGIVIGDDMVEAMYRLSESDFAAHLNNPRKAEKIVNEVVAQVAQNRAGMPKYMYELQDARRQAEFEIETILENQEKARAGNPDFSHYLGPHFRDKLRSRRETRDGITELLDEYEEILSDPEVSRKLDDLGDLLDKKKKAQDRLFDLETRGDETTKRLREIQEELAVLEVTKPNSRHARKLREERDSEIAKLQADGISTDTDPQMALNEEIYELTVSIKAISEELSEINPILVTGSVDADSLIEGAARGLDIREEEVARFIEGDDNLQESMDRILKKQIGNQKKLEGVIRRAYMAKQGNNAGDGASMVYAYGPSSVGKTLTSENIAAEFFNDEIYKMEFNQMVGATGGLERHFGSTHRPGSGPYFKKLRETDGIMLTLLDEMDKAPSGIDEVMMSATRTGVIEDPSTGEQFIVRKGFFLGTSNDITSLDDATKARLKEVEGDEVAEQQIMKEFVSEELKRKGKPVPTGLFNRGVYIVFYDNFDADELRAIANLELNSNKFINKLQKNNHMSIEFSDDVVEYITQRVLDMGSIGDASKIQDIINLEVVPYLEKLKQSKQIVEGDKVHFTVSRGNTGKPELSFYTEPWDEAGELNSSTQLARVYDYKAAGELKTWVKESLDSRYDEMSEVLRLIDDEEIANKLVRNISFSDSVVQKLPSLMESSERSLDRIFNDLGIETAIAEGFRRSKLSVLHEADGLSVEIRAVDNEDLSKGFEAVLFGNKSDGSDGIQRQLELSANGWVDPQEIAREVTRPTVSIPIDHVEIPEQTLLDQYREEEVTFVTHGEGANHRANVVSGKTTLKTNTHKSRSRGWLKRAEDEAAGKIFKKGDGW